MYQRKADVVMLNAVKSVLADEGLTLEMSVNTRRSAYPHQPYVDTLYVLPPRRRRPKLVLTGTRIPLYTVVSPCLQRCVTQTYTIKDIKHSV